MKCQSAILRTAHSHCVTLCTFSVPVEILKHMPFFLRSFLLFLNYFHEVLFVIAENLETISLNMCLRSNCSRCYN